LPSAELRAVHELFVAGEVDASYLDSTPLRRVVAESWQRSLAKGVDPDRGGAQSSSVALSVARMRDVHPLASALPVIRRLLVSDAADSGVVVAITAADGTLLWVEGDRTAWPWIVNCRSVGRSTSRGWSSRGVVRPYRCMILTPGL
jgi:transcriptional regulator of acetoin/glycerol metabolism